MIIYSINQIKDRLSKDGDLRNWSNYKEGYEILDYEVPDGDDLGFYQQACEFLLQRDKQINISVKQYLGEEQTMGTKR